MKSCEIGCAQRFGHTHEVAEQARAETDRRTVERGDEQLRVLVHRPRDIGVAGSQSSHEDRAQLDRVVALSGRSEDRARRFDIGARAIERPAPRHDRADDLWMRRSLSHASAQGCPHLCRE